MHIDAFSGVGPLPLLGQTPGSGRTVNFQEIFRESVGEVNRLQLTAEDLIERYAGGEELDSAIVNTAVVKADLAFRTMLQIRNKLTDAFQELRQMQI